MIRHIVLMKQREGIHPTVVEAVRTGLLELPAHIDGIVEVKFGENTSPEGINQGYDLGFTVDFVDAAARDAYLPHPAHLAFVPDVQAAAADVLVFDFEL